MCRVPLPRRRPAGCDVSEALGRPLPPVTDETEFFWTSGADGILRLQECTNCSALIHPPAPICRYCRSHDMGVRAVSGHATLSSFTVNHRFSLPGLPAPYVVAQAAIVEDPRVRLTTNIVECDPEQLEIGQLVQVVFEHIDDIWLPLFRPAPQRDEIAAQAHAVEPAPQAHAVEPAPQAHAVEPAPQ
ncbi:MAG: OB-fold domain-containing protein, partial [Mycobacterium sp.]|nr:OB-fold domain-containing protein [Mycobacterium sp.]